LPGLAAA